MNEILDAHDGYSKEISREFFRSVYGFMFAALGISGAVAYYAGNAEFFLKYFVTEAGTISPLFYVVIFAPVGLALLIQMAYRRISYGALLLAFGAYAVLMGLGLATVFLRYTGAEIATTFAVTAGAFGGMAILGYTTKTDLTKFGSLLYMVFIGMFIASIVNIFIGWETMSFVISVLGVFVFTGLTAYYMQQLKNISTNEQLSGLDRSKLALVGGLQLYILFVNLFMSLLRLLGSRD